MFAKIVIFRLTSKNILLPFARFMKKNYLWGQNIETNCSIITFSKQKRMKIAVLTSGILPIPAVLGGAVENLIDFYLDYNERKAHHDITVYSVNNPLTASHPALKSRYNHYHYVETLSFGSKLKKHIHKLLHGNEYYHYTIEYYLEEALKDIRKKDYDVVVLENRPGYAPKVAKATNARIVIHQHNDFLNSSSRDGKLISRLVSRVITVSDYIAGRVKTVLDDPQKCITVHNGIDRESFSINSNKISITRSYLHLKPTDFVLLFSGRINEEKGIRQLIEAVSSLRNYTDIKLLVLGSSFFGDAINDTPFVRQLKAVAEPMGNRIIFTGFIPYNDMPSYLKLADVAIIPSMWDDPFPTSVIEAVCMGMPIITTQRGGIPEEVTPDNAILLPTDNNFVDNLSKAILKLHDNPELCKIMGEASLLRANLFEKDRFAKEFLDALAD